MTLGSVNRRERENGLALGKVTHSVCHQTSIINMEWLVLSCDYITLVGRGGGEESFSNVHRNKIPVAELPHRDMRHWAPEAFSSKCLHFTNSFLAHHFPNLPNQ